MGPVYLCFLFFWVFQYTVQQYLLLLLLLIVLSLLFVYQRSAPNVVNSSCSLPPIRLPSLQPVLNPQLKQLYWEMIIFKTYTTSATLVWDYAHVYCTLGQLPLDPTAGCMLPSSGHLLNE